MEVLVGPRSYASTAYAIEPTKDASPPPPPPPCLFIKEEDDGGEIRNRLGSGFSGKSSEEEEEEDSSDSDNSSSIGAPGDSDDDDDQEEVSSQSQARGGLASLDALDDSLPIKRGLSNHYKGKSKSFGNLSDVSLTSISVKDIIEKPENALNKRRRVLIANKRARKSFYSWQNPKSMPILASLNEQEDDEDDDQIFNNNKLEMDSSYKSPDHHRLRHPLSFKSKSCFSLADLQEEDEDEDEDEDQ